MIAEGANSNDLAVNARNEIYFTEPPTKRVWFIDAKGANRVVHEGIAFPNGVRLSPDQSLLLVDDSQGKWVWSFQVMPEGSLANGVPLHRLETMDDSSASGAYGMTVDSDGYLYVASKMGIQICDQAGRVTAIISKPQTAPLSNVVFWGRGFANAVCDEWGQGLQAPSAVERHVSVDGGDAAEASSVKVI